MHFCLRIDAVQPQKSQSDAARLKTASQKEHTSLKARKARDFKDKGVLLWAVGGYADGASEHPNPETL